MRSLDVGKEVLRGRVADNTGAVIPGATVTGKAADGTTFTVETDGEGNFTVAGLPAGNYEITVIAPNFADYKFTSFQLLAGANNWFSAELHPASISTNVEVASQSATQIETEEAELQGIISQQQVVTIGLNGRNFAQLLALTPGVSNQTQQDEAKVGVQGSAKYSVNGGRVEYNVFDVDGSDVINTGIAASRGHTTLSVYPSLDAIGELKVLTSNYGAEYGRSASGTILVTTKSGGQNFHANGYEFLRNEIFNSRGFRDLPGSAPLYRRNDFGGTLGGPIYIPNRYNTTRDKSFFFFSEEVRLERSPSTFNQAVPSLNEREGNFSDVCPSVTSGVPFNRTAYPDCPQPSAKSNGIQFSPYALPIDPNAYAILQTNLIPPANSPTGCTFSLSVDVNLTDPATWPCYDITVSPFTYWREELFRIDHNYDPANKISFRFIHDAWNTTTTAPQWQYNGVTNSFPTVMNLFTGPALDMVGHLTTLKAPSLVNDFSVGFLTQHVTLQDEPGPGATLARPAQLDAACGVMITSCGIGSIFPDSGGKIPGIVIGGANGAYGGPGFMVDTSYMPWRNANPTITIRDDLSLTWGKHLLQAGVEFVDAQQSELSSATASNTGNVQGLINYSNITATNPSTTGNTFADFLLANVSNNSNSGRLTYADAAGQIISYQQDSGQQVYANKYEILEPYLQDGWKILPNLTLNLGLRLSLFGNWTPNETKVFNFVPSKFDASLAGVITVDPTYGYLKYTGSGEPVLADTNYPDLTTLNGLVECGVGGVPASCMTTHHVNPSPRVGFAWDVNGKGTTSVRSGYGIFYEHGTGDEANTGSLTGTAPMVQTMTQNAPEGNGFSLECIDGRAPGCAAAVPAGAAFPLDVSAIPTTQVWPYIQQWSLSVEHQIRSNIVVTLAYVGSKGTHLATVLQLNQLDPVSAGNNYFGPHEPIRRIDFDVLNNEIDRGVCTNTPPSPFITDNGYHYYEQNPAYANLEIACSTGINPNSLRRYPGYGRILSVENRANSSYQGLQFTAHYVHGPNSIGVSDSYSHSIDEASDRFGSAIGNALDPSSHRASSDFDQRNIFNLSYDLQLSLDRLVRILDDHGKCADYDDACRLAHPWGSSQPSPALIRIVKGWELSGLLLMESGTPFTVINGGTGQISALDNAGVANGLGAGSYPDVVPAMGHCNVNSVSTAASSVIGPLLGNLCQFVAPRGLTFGNAGRNSMNNPKRMNNDIAFHRFFTLPYESKLEIRAEIFNLFNHPQYRIYNSEKGNTASNIVSCYGDITAGYSAAADSCMVGNAFLHPVDAHRPRTMQFGVKWGF
jgi:hypothetical protein